MFPDGSPPTRDGGSGARDSPLLCSHCNDVLGVYEPIVVLVDGMPPQRTSRAAMPTLPDGVVLHQACFRLRGAGGG